MIRNCILPILYGLTLLLAHSQEKGEPVSIFNGKDLTGWIVKAKEHEKEKAATYWSVVNGAIQVDTKGDTKHDYVWLCYDLEVADFDLTLKVRSTRFTKGNSGIQIRSRYLKDKKKGRWLSGPQIDLHPRDPFRIGLIYDETKGVNRWIHPSKKNWGISWTDANHTWLWRTLEKDGGYMENSNAKEPNRMTQVGLTKEEREQGWNVIRIKAQGHKIQTWVNHLPVADYDGSKDLTTEMHKKLKVGTTGKIFLQLHAKDDIGMQFKDIKLLKLLPEKK